MKRIITLTAALLLSVVTIAAPVWADSIHVGDTTTINNTANGGAGGAGGAGGNAAASASATGGTHVQTNTQINTQVTTQGQEQGQGQLQGQGQYQGQSYQGEQTTSVKVETPRQAPAAIPAALAVSSLTCYGSWSIAASTPFGGVGAGFPTKDADCERARNALIFVNLGMQNVALALLSQNPDNAAAMKAAGVKYPGQVAMVEAPAVVKASAVAASVAVSSEPVSKCGKDMVVTPSGFCRWK